MENKAYITVLGVGNILLTDEGLGVHIINELAAEYKDMSHVQFIDGGTMGMELLGYMRDTEYLLLVDAISGGEEPGTIYEFQHSETEEYFTEHISVHEVGMQDILRIHALLEEPLKDAVVIGAEPFSLEIGLEVSPAVKERFPEIKARIIKQIRKWQEELGHG